MSDKPTVAIVEDDAEIRRLVCSLLAKEGIEVLSCASGSELERALERGKPDVIILDIMLPGDDGLTLCRKLRSTMNVGILMVSAKGDDVDKIVGLEIGADDYLPKPFNSRELVARVRALLRRVRDNGGAPPQDDGRQSYRFGPWTLERGGRELTNAQGQPVELTTGEFDLLLAFLQHPQRVLSRDQLLDWTRGRMAAPFDRSVDIQVSRLRRKLDLDGGGTVIRTVRGGGYLFALPVERN
jgi:two-component system, OmpR family, response regulator